MNILFSQVREDPDIELWYINNFVNNLDNLDNLDKRYLIIGSGGCTILSLLAHINHDENIIIDVIDQNIEQLYLIKLKISVIKYFNDIDKVLLFFEGNFSEYEYDNIIINLDLDDKCKTFWKNNMNIIYYGVNRSGVFERLFKVLGIASPEKM